MNRLKVTKIGLLNFWLYDEEEYDFYGGKLILRGSNGSGKSVTMQSFIPLILDGNKSPDRLDPFGSKERKIEDYIIGDAESGQKEESTAYLYMEIYDEQNNRYVTIGLGFRGRKGRPVESWGFALKDGKRVGKDFFLYKDAINKIPLTKNELKSRLGMINEFTDSAKDYKAMVNRLLFGFPNLDTYDEFIKLLLQLRSNKLSKDLKPTNLVNVLNTVLQPLTEEDLRPLSEAIEQMNKTKEQIEKLEKNYKSLNEFLKTYRNYNEINLLTKTKNYKKVSDDYNVLIKNIDNSQKQLDNYKQLLINKRVRQDEVIEKIKLDEATKEQLDNNDLKKKVESLNKIEQVIITLEEKIDEIDKKIDINEKDKIETSKRLSVTDEEIYKLKKEIEDITIDLKSLADYSYFDEIIFFIDEMSENFDKNISFDTIFMSIKHYKDKINKLLELLEEEQRIVSESESSRMKLEKLVQTYKNIEHDLNNKYENFKESIMAWEEDFINKLNNNDYLKLDDFSKKQIYDLMNDYKSENYAEVTKIYQSCGQELINETINQKLILENKKVAKQKELDELKVEYEKIENSDDFEIPSYNIETDNILIENNITSIPFYKCVEFKDNIDEKIKNHIESTLLDLNILNAKIIKESDIPIVEKLDAQILYLKKSTKKKDNLLKYFNIVLDEKINISEEYIKSILESISINQDDLVSISDNGISKIDFLNSISDNKYKQTFIGYLKRLEYKNNKLKEIKSQVEVLSNEIININNLTNNLENKISVIELEIKNLPSSKFIDSILYEISNLNMSLEWNDKNQKDLEKELELIDNQLREIKNQILDNQQGLYIPLNLQSYKEVFKNVCNINEILFKLQKNYNSYISKLEIQYSQKEKIEALQDNIDYLESDKTEKDNELQININNKNTINEILKTKEYTDQKEKLMQLENELNNLNIEKENLIRELSQIETQINYEEKSLNNLLQEKEQQLKELNVYKEIFLREYKLNYVYQNDIIDIDTTIKNILKDIKDKKEMSLSEALDKFYSDYNHYALELNEYSLKNIKLFYDYTTDDEKIKKIYDDNVRADVTCMYQGIKLNIIKLCEKLENDIEENRDLISEQDRHLFEDILLNTVGDKIRNRINSSNEWIDKINDIMAKMQENSALSFKLKWNSISAEREGEIDTKELVRILKIDPKLLKDSDTEKLGNHFRIKIKKAEELYQDSYISFTKIIQDVLDYRTWFTFQLQYQRKGMSSFNELTDKTYSKLSGGERAKSMYIPLFASVYAKLKSAKDNSLRLIALDEAFAGVDEDNIREMFGILKYLDIDFVINSQLLWGDYDTVEDLSICELIRPNNSNVVTVERYRWNGKYKEIINNRKSFNEQIENA